MNKILRIIIYTLITLLTGGPLAFAAKDFYIKNNSQTFMYVNGTSGNVGIGSLSPGTTLDINGTVRTGGFTLTGNGANNGYVMVGNSVGIGTWMSTNSLGVNGTNYWSLTTAAGNVGVSTTNTVGIGTTSAGVGAGLVVMNGNVGIGTWAPGNSLEVVGGNIGIGTAYNLIGIGTTSTILTLRIDTSSIYAGWQAGASTTVGGIANAAVGYQALQADTIGQSNSVVGFRGLSLNTTGNFNSSMGYYSLYSNTTGQWNSAFGAVALNANTVGNSNTSMGTNALSTLTGNYSDNTALGFDAGMDISGGSIQLTSASRSVFLGDNTMALANGDTNEIVIGYNATGYGSNSVTLGNALVTATILRANVGIGTISPGGALDVEGTLAPIVFQGLANTKNVGIGSFSPGQILDVQGSVRALGFTLSTQGPISGYVLTASDSAGDTTWTSGGAVSGWTVSGNNVYETSSGNVGIGTTTVNQGSLVVTNGNVGIGTWVVNGGSLIVASGNVGIGTFAPSATLDVNGGVSYGVISNLAGGAGSSINTTSGNGAIAGGYASGLVGGGIGTITSSGDGSVALGESTGTSSAAVLSATSFGSIAMGAVSSSGGAPSSLTSSNAGSIAMGVAQQGGNITSSAAGSIAMGNANGINSNIISSGSGSIAMGYSDNSGIPVQATGSGSVAVGIDVQANANSAMALGSGVVNNTASSFMVGFSTTPTLTVTGTNVGIGTLNPFGGKLIVSGGNMGIGTLSPGQMLDVQGTVRAKGLAMSGQAPISGYVLTASDSAGDATWTSGGAVSGWTVSGNNVYETSGGNVGIGTTLLTTSALTVMNGNVGIGTWAPGNSLEVVGGNIGIGTAYNLIGIGTTSTILSLRTDTSSIYVGWQAGASTTTASQNTAVGSLALSQNTGGSANTAVGDNTLLKNITGSNNSALGFDALYSNTTGVANSAFGYTALYNNTGGQSNSAMGYDALYSNTTGQSNVAMGVNALYTNSTGFYNTALGVNALYDNNTGSNNTAVGYYALDFIAGAYSDNTAIGYYAGTWLSSGAFLTSPAQSTFLGDYTRALVNGDTNEIVIGYAAIGNGSNSVTLGNSLVTTTILRTNVGIGTFIPGGALDVEGTLAPIVFQAIANTKNVGIGSFSPGTTLDVNGTVRMGGLTLTGNGAGNGYVMIGNSVGVGTWMPTSSLGIAGTNYWSLTAAAGNVGISTTNTVGIGTTSAGPGSGLLVMNGNVGIGTWAPGGALDIKTGNNVLVESGNVGIGSTLPGQTLDVTGQMRGSQGLVVGTGSTGGSISSGGLGSIAAGQATAAGGGITTSGHGGIAMGYTLGGSNGSITSSNDGAIAMGVSTNAGGNASSITASGSGAVAIGYSQGGGPASVLTSGGTGSIAMGEAINGTLQATGTASVAIGQNVQATANNAFALGLSVINPNASSLMVGFNATPTLTVTGTGVGIGTSSPFGGGLIVLPASTGNVGIGSLTPGQMLDVQGTVRALGFTMSTHAPISGYVLTASDSAGDSTWTSAGGVSGWTASGNNVYETSGGSVGIGTTLLTTSGLTVMNGNVGIGTWVPGVMMDVIGTARTSLGYFTSGGYTQSGTSFNNFTGNVGISSAAPGQKLDVVGGIRDSVGLVLGTAVPGQSISAGQMGAIAGGWASAGNITANGTGSIAEGYTTGGVSASIASSGNGSMAMGVSNGSSTFAASGSSGSYALGYAQNGTLQATGAPSFAFGYVTGGGTLQATGTADFALGDNVQALGANDSFALGSSVVNPNASSFMVGFNATPTLTVTSTGVGIGTSSPFGGGLIVLPASSGNVGIGSLTPGQMLDVQGTVRALSFTMSAHAPISGYVLTASDSAGDSTWTSAGGVSGWTASGNNVYETSGGSVGIGTTLLTTSGLTVMNGNVGIGTWIPAVMLDVKGTLRDTAEFVNGNIGVGTTFINGTGEAALSVMNGNVGIGTWVPGMILDVQGSMRNLGEIVNGALEQGSAVASSGSVALGNIGGPNGIITSSGGSMAGGESLGGGNTSTISTTNQGSIAWGYVGSGGGFPSSLSATGSGSVALGYALSSGTTTSLLSSGLGSFAMGYVSNGSLQATGQASVAMGQNVQATANNAFALGLNVNNPTASSFMVGFSTTPALTVTNTTVGVGIGTYTTATGALDVQGGNVGIGTFSPFGGGLIVLPASTGNVGIGSLTPGTTLDVNGTVRMGGFTLTGNGAAAGYVMVSSTAVGVGTWMPQSTLPLATVNAANTNDVSYYSSSNAFSGGTGFQTNGTNVGIGTSGFATASLQIIGNVGIGTVKNGDTFITTAPPNGGMLIEGNVGIGTTATTSILQFGPGTSSKPPITLATGTIGASGTGTAGAIEFDGTAFYATSAASSRQVVTAQQFMVLTAAFTLGNNNTAPQKMFNASANGALTLQSSTTYLYNLTFSLSGMSSTSSSFGFTFAGTAITNGATYTFISYGSKMASLATATNAQTDGGTTGGDTTLVSNGTGPVGVAYISGIITVGSGQGGTLIPEVDVTRAPTGTAPIVGAGSYFLIYPIGNNTVTYQGEWS